MTKADLINLIADEANLNHKRAESAVNEIFDLMSEALIAGTRIEIRGFGSFVNRVYRSYKGRNPKSGVLVQVPPKVVPFFKVGKDLKERVDFVVPAAALTSEA